MAKYASMVVEGDSMEPTYRAGDWLMGRWANYKLGGWNRVRIGDVVVIERDEQPGIFYVKRVNQVRGSGKNSSEIFILSDNDAGTDSRQWGWLPVTSVRAKIQFRMKRA
jgi:signal peptidase I